VSTLELPPIEAIIELHDEWIKMFGGASGVRDRGSLESSIGRAMQVLSYDEDADTIMAAAAVCVSICRNHPFIDGNKRAAFGSLGLILGMNGYYLDVSEHEAAAVIIALAAGKTQEDTFRSWVRQNTIQEG